MVGKAKPANISDKKRMELIKGLGCVACVVNNWPDSQCEVHHVVEGRVRLGHRHTMGLCLWHHRGLISGGFEQYDKQQMGGMLGPSMAHGSHGFREFFGSQATLVQLQDYIIQRFTDDPWLELSMPRGIVLDIFYKWSELRQGDAAP